MSRAGNAQTLRWGDCASRRQRVQRCERRSADVPLVDHVEAGGSTAALDNPTSPTPAFVADQPGTYVAQLIVERRRPRLHTVERHDLDSQLDPGGECRPQPGGDDGRDRASRWQRSSDADAPRCSSPGRYSLNRRTAAPRYRSVGRQSDVCRRSGWHLCRAADRQRWNTGELPVTVTITAGQSVDVDILFLDTPTTPQIGWFMEFVVR